MKKSKLSGIDGLTSEVLKNLWEEIRELLYRAFLACIQKGIYPKPQRQV